MGKNETAARKKAKLKPKSQNEKKKIGKSKNDASRKSKESSTEGPYTTKNGSSSSSAIPSNLLEALHRSPVAEVKKPKSPKKPVSPKKPLSPKKPVSPNKSPKKSPIRLPGRKMQLEESSAPHGKSSLLMKFLVDSTAARLGSWSSSESFGSVTEKKVSRKRMSRTSLGSFGLGGFSGWQTDADVDHGLPFEPYIVERKVEPPVVKEEEEISDHGQVQSVTIDVLHGDHNEAADADHGEHTKREFIGWLPKLPLHDFVFIKS